jgi:hypothetical protein
LTGWTAYVVGLAGFRGGRIAPTPKGWGAQNSGATLFRTGGPASYSKSSASIQKAQLWTTLHRAKLLQITRQLIGKANLCRFHILGLNALSAPTYGLALDRDVRCLGQSGLPNAERSRSF